MIVGMLSECGTRMFTTLVTSSKSNSRMALIIPTAICCRRIAAPIEITRSSFESLIERHTSTIGSFGSVRPLFLTEAKNRSSWYSTMRISLEFDPSAICVADNETRQRIEDAHIWKRWKTRKKVESTNLLTINKLPEFGWKMANIKVRIRRRTTRTRCHSTRLTPPQPFHVLELLFQEKQSDICSHYKILEYISVRYPNHLSARCKKHFNFLFPSNIKKFPTKSRFFATRTRVRCPDLRPTQSRWILCAKTIHISPQTNYSCRRRISNPRSKLNIVRFPLFQFPAFLLKTK